MLALTAGDLFFAYGFALRFWSAALEGGFGMLAQSTFGKALLTKHLSQRACCKPLTAKRLLQSACGNGDGLNPGAVHGVKTSCQGGRWKMLQNAVKLKADQSHSKTKN